MTARRILGLFVTASMAHFTMVGGDLVCSKHGEQQSQPAAHQHSAPDPVDLSAHDHGQQKPPCKTPGIPACCQIMASCAITMTRAAESHVASSDDHAAARIALASIFSSRTFGPEPPPPKA